MNPVLVPSMWKVFPHWGDEYYFVNMGEARQSPSFRVGGACLTDSTRQYPCSTVPTEPALVRQGFSEGQWQSVFLQRR